MNDRAALCSEPSMLISSLILLLLFMKLSIEHLCVIPWDPNLLAPLQHSNKELLGIGLLKNYCACPGNL